MSVFITASSTPYSHLVLIAEILIGGDGYLEPRTVSNLELHDNGGTGLLTRVTIRPVFQRPGEFHLASVSFGSERLLVYAPSPSRASPFIFPKVAPADPAAARFTVTVTAAPANGDPTVVIGRPRVASDPATGPIADPFLALTGGSLVSGPTATPFVLASSFGSGPLRPHYPTTINFANLMPAPMGKPRMAFYAIFYGAVLVCNEYGQAGPPAGSGILDRFVPIPVQVPGVTPGATCFTYRFRVDVPPGNTVPAGPQYLIVDYDPDYNDYYVETRTSITGADSEFELVPATRYGGAPGSFLLRCVNDADGSGVGSWVSVTSAALTLPAIWAVGGAPPLQLAEMALFHYDADSAAPVAKPLESADAKQLGDMPTAMGGAAGPRFPLMDEDSGDEPKGDGGACRGFAAALFRCCPLLWTRPSTSPSARSSRRPDPLRPRRARPFSLPPPDEH